MHIPQKGQAIIGNPFSLFKLKGNVDCGTRLGWIFLPEISSGLMDHMMLVSIQTLVFCSGVAHWLNELKRVEADDGYIGDTPQKVKCPGCMSNPTNNQAMQNKVESRRKSLSGGLKNWEILKSMYHHDLMKHGNVFWAIAVITQISIKSGEQLFEVDYSDL